MSDPLPYTVHLGDCVQALQEHVADQSVHLTVTSPPYDTLRDYTGFSWDFSSLCAELWRVTVPGGVVMWNVADAVIKGSESGTSMRQALVFMDQGFRLHDTMIYEKGNFSNPSSNRYHQIWEYMFIFSRGTPRVFNAIKDKPITGMDDPDHARLGTFGKNTVRQKDGTMKERGQRKVYGEFGMRTNIWRMKTAGQERPGKSIAHPAKMPNAMAHDHVVTWSNPGDMVLDPFAGSGTTGVQALKLGRKFTGCELSPEYHSMCVKNCAAVMPLAILFTDLGKSANI